MGDSVHLIDSTTVALSELSATWARFSRTACGAKLHLVLDPDADRPVHADITPSTVNDITAAKAMPITPGVTYVFDLGYYDFAWWAKLEAAGCRIVTRLKANTPLTDVIELEIPDTTGRRDLVRPHRPVAGPAAAVPTQSVPGPGPRGVRADPDRQGPAHHEQ